MNTQTSFPYFRDSILRLKENRPAMFGFWILIFLFVAAVIAPLFTPYSYYETHLSLKNYPPSQQFWFGTDELGRNIFSRIWLGARISLFVGISAALIDMIIGVVYGAFAGFVGGKIDELMMRFCDILNSLPQLLIVIILLVLMGPGLSTIIIALTLTGWINMARIIRGHIYQIKHQDFILAAKALGASRTRILTQHLITNAVGSIITTVTITIPGAIFTESFLSFLGLGVQAPMASWGTMASDGLPALRFYPWRLFFPAFFISMTMFAFNLLGDGLRDAFDPRLRK
jgi:oligopeptide transport system permease protein